MMNKKRGLILGGVILAIVAAALLVVFVILPNLGGKVKSESAPVYSFDDPDWWDHAVFYEIFVRSYYDSNGDGIGDFNGITQKLDYLNDGDPNTSTDLGVNALWLMPIYPSPSYHGYDVTDYRGVNPDYGTMADFQNLVKEAHKRGIHVILDFVINHTSDQNPWFISAQDPTSSYRDWYIWSDTDLGYLGPWGETVWHPASSGGFYYGIFTAQMPDLNYRNQAVTDEIDSIAKYWLTYVGVDGFRVDGARHLIEDGETQANTPETLTWFKNFRDQFKTWKPTAMSVGEVWDASYNSVKYIQDGSFDLVFDFDLASAILSGVNMGSASAINGHIVAENETFKGEGMATFLTNHDMERVINQLKDDPVKAGHAATVLLTMPGTPFIYYGEEIGMQGKKPDEQLRTPMQWSAELNGGFTSGSPWEYLAIGYKTANVAVESEDPASLLSLYRKLIQIRLQHTAFMDGEYIKVTTSAPALYASLSRSQDELMLTVINLKGAEIAAPRLTFFGTDLEGSYTITPLLTLDESGQEIQIANSSFTLSSTIPAGYNQIYLLTPKK
ncbi:MAG: alpha-amylase family glycosyl hydrolase [Anaerolineaceae bacterium]|nr:alpha-amylase family glycosyl hydrolase [Anaerolineaceae bacterium]